MNTGVSKCLATAFFAVTLLACGVQSADYQYPVIEENGRPGAGNPSNPSTPLAQPARANACGGVTLGTKRVPLYIVVALDRSNSMDEDNKWVSATTGLSAFFESPQNDVHASLAVFPQKESSCGGDFVTPVVQMAPLPSGTFRATFAQTKLMGGTPLRPALEGAATNAALLQKQLGMEARVVVALVSDGKPTANLCSGNDLAGVVDIARVAYTSAGVLTYSVGMPGALQENLNEIASAGGTVTGTLITPLNAGAQLTATFDAIRGQFACDVAMPALDQGNKYAPDQVNVQFTPVGGAAATVPYSIGCANGDGWRYDNPASPTRIVLCPQTCERGRSGTARVEVELGCPTQGDRPR